MNGDSLAPLKNGSGAAGWQRDALLRYGRRAAQEEDMDTNSKCSGDEECVACALHVVSDTAGCLVHTAEFCQGVRKLCLGALRNAVVNFDHLLVASDTEWN